MQLYDVSVGVLDQLNPDSIIE